MKVVIGDQVTDDETMWWIASRYVAKRKAGYRSGNELNRRADWTSRWFHRILRPLVRIAHDAVLEDRRGTALAVLCQELHLADAMTFVYGRPPISLVVYDNVQRPINANHFTIGTFLTSASAGEVAIADLSLTTSLYVGDGPVRFSAAGGLPLGIAADTDYWVSR